ncbi:MAG: succinylglutamate desuccinylase/aspartoacylase family protein [Pseudomonadales bacterium]
MASCQPPVESARAATPEGLPPAVQAPPPITPQLAVLLPTTTRTTHTSARPARLPVPAPDILPVVRVIGEEPQAREPGDSDDVFWPDDMGLGEDAGAATEVEAEPEAEVADAATAAGEGASASEAGEAVPVAGEEAVAMPEATALEMLGERIEPGTFARLSWAATETFAGNDIPAAVLVAHGVSPGPTLCLTAAIHGDELNGIETVRRVLHQIDPGRLAGTVIGVPIVNLQGFQRSSRYLPDRRDLNRFFPGNARGSAASRIAYSLFSQVILQCSALVDLHTGSFHRTNLPQLRADLNDAKVVEVTQGFGSTVILHSPGGDGTLRGAATAAGIPAVTLEAGMPLQVQEDAVNHSVKGIFTLLDTMGMYGKRSLWGNPEPIYYQSRWVRADHGGILAGEVKLGRRVQPGDVLGTVIDPISNEQNVILSPYQGRVIGMAMDQFVMPGYATFHIGIEAAVSEATELPAEDDLDHASEDYEGALGDSD